MTFKGGYADNHFPVKSQEHTTQDFGPVHFINIEKNAEWILQAVVGKCEKASLKRSTLFATLKAKLQEAHEMAQGDAAVAAGDAADDPMNVFREIGTPGKAPKRKTKSRRGKNCPRLVTMPAKEPNKHPRNTATHNVLLLPMSTNSLWIRKDDIAWMIEYLADEVGPNGSQGVPTFDGGVADEPNCKAEGVHIWWDWHADDQWEATGLSGPLQDKTFTCCIATFTEAKWAIVDAINSYGVSYSDANRDQLKQAAFDYIENHCVQLLLARRSA